MTCSLVPLESLTPTEEVDDLAVNELEKKILHDGYWTTPLMVHREALFIMDGHHRLAVAGKLGLKQVPVMLMDYETVSVEARRPGEVITASQVISMAEGGQKFPAKTTRHHVDASSMPNLRISLSALRCQEHDGAKGLHMNTDAFKSHSEETTR